MFTRTGDQSQMRCNIHCRLHLSLHAVLMHPCLDIVCPCVTFLLTPLLMAAQHLVCLSVQRNTSSFQTHECVQSVNVAVVVVYGFVDFRAKPHRHDKPIVIRGRHAEEESLALKEALSTANSRLAKLDSLEADVESRAKEIQVN